MNSNQEILNSLWADLIIEEFVRNDVKLFCISPGSRSTPLTVAVAKNNKTSQNSVIHYDERGASFFALGHSKVMQIPSVLICTSGTAAANYFPAIIEAANENIPLIVLTADRPPELRDTGANQTIDQIKMYGKYVNWFFDLPCPDEKINEQFLLTTIDQAVHRSLSPYKGVVHLNCMFREPFLIGNDTSKYIKSEKVKQWHSGKSKFTDYGQTEIVIDNFNTEKISEIINNSKSGFIIAGRLQNENERQSIIELAEKINWLIFPDINSGLRLGAKSKNIFPYYDLMISNKFFNQSKVDTILSFGQGFTSKRLWQLIEKNNYKNYIHVAENQNRIDPAHSVTYRIVSSISSFCKAIIPKIEMQLNKSFDYKINIKIENLLKKEIDNKNQLTEPTIARLITQMLPNNHVLFSASSRPIRDFDSYGSPEGSSIIFGSNRGASGIDGTIASAVGFAKAHNKSLTLLIGDLAFLHDMNSLPLLKQLFHPATVVIVNNNGGGIFS
ncbi:MAG: 2-succinyl-5-enolpyruvyl-6-hydroxy-3-cyclohexene-1-carboxylic-acid synthase, partial [candidate division Zixibacteria bacterium]|nr:2-succinyl-5-enolpyruvyl-6-hydroxy-3-cyclohexene-1-carboxylic-acid synthase [candidate division Zixibacteria bacterium]